MNINEYKMLVLATSPIEDLVAWAADIYTELRIKYNLSTGDGKCWEGNIIEYGHHYITTEWSYSWSYGGHIEGTCEIPIGAILGTKAERVKFIESLIKKEVENIEKHKKKKEVEEIDLKRKVYEKLKKEFK